MKVVIAPYEGSQPGGLHRHDDGVRVVIAPYEGSQPEVTAADPAGDPPVVIAPYEGSQHIIAVPYDQEAEVRVVIAPYEGSQHTPGLTVIWTSHHGVVIAPYEGSQLHRGGCAPAAHSAASSSLPTRDRNPNAPAATGAATQSSSLPTRDRNRRRRKRGRPLRLPVVIAPYEGSQQQRAAGGGDPAGQQVVIAPYEGSQHREQQLAAVGIRAVVIAPYEGSQLDQPDDDVAGAAGRHRSLRGIATCRTGRRRPR